MKCGVMPKLNFLLLLCVFIGACSRDPSSTTSTPSVTPNAPPAPTPIPLPPIGDTSNPTGVDVYVAGSEYNGSVSVAKYWKNGQAVALTDGTKNAVANSIVVVDSDVYVAGYETDISIKIAKYWKNGQAFTLADGRSAQGNSIAVRGSDVYVAGTDYSIVNSTPAAKCWKNGQDLFNLPVMTRTFSLLNSIVLVDSEVYVAGGEMGYLIAAT